MRPNTAMSVSKYFTEFPLYMFSLQMKNVQAIDQNERLIWHTFLFFLLTKKKLYNFLE